MKPSHIWAGMAMLAMSLFTGIASAGDADFTLINNTGSTVHSVFVWPSGSKYPGRDQLGDSTLTSGNSRFLAQIPNGACHHTLRITTERGVREEQFGNIDLCRLMTITLQYNPQTDNFYTTEE